MTHEELDRLKWTPEECRAAQAAITERTGNTFPASLPMLSMQCELTAALQQVERASQELRLTRRALEMACTYDHGIGDFHVPEDEVCHWMESAKEEIDAARHRASAEGNGRDE